MNKNLLLSVPALEYIEAPTFDTKVEIYEWVLYQMEQLYMVVESYLYHNIKSSSLIEYVDYTRSTLINTMNLSRSIHNENFTDTSDLCLKIAEAVEKTAKICRSIRSR
jgi:hypothetical protein